jgi:GH24 family phage-related lysozyme (muramidase)
MTLPFKPADLFGKIREMLHARGSTLRQDEVDAIGAILESGAKPTAPSEPERAFVPTKVSVKGEQLIKSFEGCARRRPDGLVEAYPDPGTDAEPWTIGWGATGADHFNGGRIRRGTVWTQAQCDQRKREDLERFAREVNAALGSAIGATSQAQFDALVSFHYNTGAIAHAALTRKHIAGDFKGAAREFGRWVNAGGRPMKGLIRRRAAEAALYVSGS